MGARVLLVLDGPCVMFLSLLLLVLSLLLVVLSLLLMVFSLLLALHSPCWSSV